VADSALVTEDNLNEAEKNGTWFLTRLPATYGECSRVITEAVAANAWIDIGPLAAAGAGALYPSQSTSGPAGSRYG